jgi:hypothetical protein
MVVPDFLKICIFLILLSIVQSDKHLSVSNNHSRCILPSCVDVSRSRLFSPRCNTSFSQWPLLVTSTPRSGTTFAAAELANFGARITNDWNDFPGRDGTASWMYAFEDDNNFGPMRTQGKRFSHILHQVRDPLESLASICTEPLARPAYFDFLTRHINITRPGAHWSHAQATLEFWIGWHRFLDRLHLPTYQIELVNISSLLELVGLHGSENYPKAKQKTRNEREHRPAYTWHEVYTLDRRLAREIWDLAARFGYTYDVAFDDLKCLQHLPSCDENQNFATNRRKPKPGPNEDCPPGTHPDLPHTAPFVFADPAKGTLGWIGFVAEGCEEENGVGRSEKLSTESYNRIVVSESMIKYNIRYTVFV